MKKLLNLNNREDRNIFKLEIDEIIANIVEETFFAGIFNSPSSRSFSYLNSALLDSLNKNVKMF
jgi:hypothetical protein